MLNLKFVSFLKKEFTSQRPVPFISQQWAASIIPVPGVSCPHLLQPLSPPVTSARCLEPREDGWPVSSTPSPPPAGGPVRVSPGSLPSHERPAAQWPQARSRLPHVPSSPPPAPATASAHPGDLEWRPDPGGFTHLLNFHGPEETQSAGLAPAQRATAAIRTRAGGISRGKDARRRRQPGKRLRIAGRTRTPVPLIHLYRCGGRRRAHA